MKLGHGKIRTAKIIEQKKHLPGLLTYGLPMKMWHYLPREVALDGRENETFNTLKNQGYYLEHNYGHGQKNLSINMVNMMFTAFLIDQIQQACCQKFRKAFEKHEWRPSYFWNDVTTIVKSWIIGSWDDLFTIIIEKDRKSAGWGKRGEIGGG